MHLLRLTATVFVCAFTAAALCQSSAEPVAVIDTTAGRLRCALRMQERPATTAAFIALAEGTKPWTAPDGSIVKGKPFYEGTRLFPSSLGVSGGVRAALDPKLNQKAAGASFPAETSPRLLFDRPGLLAMAARNDQAGPSRFFITDHANTEADGYGVIFGQCDEASVQLVTQMRQTLAETDNHPAKPIAIDHIAIVAAGSSLPPLASSLGRAAILPALSAQPLAAPSGPEPTGPVAVIETSAGTLRCRLFEKESPVATATFLGLVEGTKDWIDPATHTVQQHRRFYDGQRIDRVLPDYYIQFGDITGDISGKTDIGFRFKTEAAPGLTFDRPGRLAFGNGGPDTNNGELFFALNPMHALDGSYPILGQCDQASVSVLETIADLPRDASNRPLQPVLIRHIVIQR